MATLKQELSWGDDWADVAYWKISTEIKLWFRVACDCGHTRQSHLHPIKSISGQYVVATCKGLDCYCASFEEETICPECLRSNLNEDKTLCWNCQGV